MPGSVEEGDRAENALMLVLGLIGRDVLSDAARLAGGAGSHAAIVQQRRLSVVDVAHYGDDWGTWSACHI